MTAASGESRRPGDDEPTAGGTAVGRRIVGAWVVLLLLSGLVVLGGLNDRITGLAGRTPPVGPPPVGACLLDLDTAEVVPCADEHAAEVVLSWAGTPEDQPVPEPWSSQYQPLSDPEIRCQKEVTGMVSAIRHQAAADGPALLAPETFWFASLVTRSPTDGGEAWTACVAQAPVVETGPARIRGTVQALVTDPLLPRPASMRLCASTGSSVMPCSRPHDTEIIGMEMERVSAADIEARLLDEAPDQVRPRTERCAELAAAFLGAPLQAHDGALTSSTTTTRVEFDPDESDTGLWTVRCALVVDRGRVVGTLAGVGEGDLPWG